MSDGALSQAEIDALLSGGGGASTATAAPPKGMPDTDKKALEAFLASTTNAQSSNLSMMTGATVGLSGPQLTVNGRELFLSQLPETVTVVKVDFSSGFPGEHMFIIPEDGAKSIASLMNKEENIQLDEMAMSVIGEVVSQMVGHQITALADKTGNKSIASVPPEATNILKTVVALPAGDFVAATYQLDLGGGNFFQIWEVLGPSVASDIARALSGGQAQNVKGAAPGMPSGIGGLNMSGMQMGMGGIGMDAGGGGMPFGQTNVQSVQFPNLMPHGGHQESGNIGLIMDVYMEMTVELGRTRKLIKEILAMGEGTIIELDKLAGEPVDILVNHKLIAKGEVVVIDENFGVRVTEIVSPAERMNGMG
ncbi:MAG: flagellar motor switch protein FliN [Treponema sp.]|nr:flagellar motor switch protein FliN [Treponema sp.]